MDEKEQQMQDETEKELLSVQPEEEIIPQEEGESVQEMETDPQPKIGETPEMSGGKDIEKSLRGMVGGMAVVAVALIGVLVSGVLDNTAYRPIAYAKDNTLFVSDVKHEAYATTTISEGGQFGYAYLAWGVDVSEDNKVMYYQGNVAADNTFTLYRRGTSAKDDTAVVLAEGVVAYQASDNGKTVAYITKDGSLGCYNTRGGSKVIAEGLETVASAFAISQDGNYVTYRQADGMTDHGDAAYRLLQYEVSKGETTTMTEQAESFMFRKDGAYYLKYPEGDNGTFEIYEYTFGKGETQLAENASGVMVGEDRNTLMYMVNSGAEMAYADLVVDDCAESDAQMTEPNYEAYGEDQAEAMMQDYYAYEAKKMRDSLRESLAENGTIAVKKDIYVFNGGKATLVAEGAISGGMAGDNVLYLAADAETVEKVKLSEVLSLDDIVSAYYGKLGESAVTYYKTLSGEPIVLEANDLTLQNIKAAKDGSVITYPAAKEDGSTVTMVAQVKGKGLTNEKELPMSIGNLTFANAGHGLAYLDGAGALWYQGDGDAVKLAESCINFFFAENSEKLYYISEEDGGDGALLSYDGSSVKALDSDVYFAYDYGQGVIGYLKNYDAETGIGDLYYVQKGKPTLVDTGVSNLYLYF